jgi:hypothetical protein
MDIPVIKDKAPSFAKRLAQLVNWAEGDKAKLSAGFLAYENEGDKPDDYLFQIAFIKDECLVTNEEMIKDAGKLCKEYKEWKEYTKIIFEIRAHLELYYAKIGSVAPWGSRQFNKLKSSGRTPRVLEGPHKGGQLRPNEKRWIILDDNNELVYGPTI